MGRVEQGVRLVAFVGLGAVTSRLDRCTSNQCYLP